MVQNNRNFILINNGRKTCSSKIGSYEMAKVKGGVELHYGSNAIGEYVWWYGDDGKMYGYYTVYYA